jgi:hypothetical protein
MRIYGAATVLTASLVVASQLAAQKQLVAPADIERISGFKGVSPAPKALQTEGYQSFVRSSDNMVVLYVSLPGPSSHEAIEITRNAIPHEDVTGVGDEAFFISEGHDLWIRKGDHGVVVRTGVDAKGSALLTPAQLKEIGKLVVARL